MKGPHRYEFYSPQDSTKLVYWFPPTQGSLR